MTTKVEKTVMVNVPVQVAYNQWTQFEEFPHFMGGVQKVTQLSDDRLEWVAEIAGVRRQWEARILEQVPDRKVAWAATEGATNAGAVTFEDVGGGQTAVHLSLEYEPEGLVEKVGDKLNIVEKQAQGDLDRFKAFIESEGYATGAWRGSVNQGGGVGTPGVDDAAASMGDKGKAGISPTAAAVGAGVAAAAVAGVMKARSGSSDQPEDMDMSMPSQPVDTTYVAPVDTYSTETTDAGYGDTMGTTGYTDAGSGYATTESAMGTAYVDPTLPVSDPESGLRAPGSDTGDDDVFPEETTTRY